MEPKDENIFPLSNHHPQICIRRRLSVVAPCILLPMIAVLDVRRQYDRNVVYSLENGYQGC